MWHTLHYARGTMHRSLKGNPSCLNLLHDPLDHSVRKEDDSLERPWLSDFMLLSMSVSQVGFDYPKQEWIHPKREIQKGVSACKGKACLLLSAGQEYEFQQVIRNSDEEPNSLHSTWLVCKAVRVWLATLQFAPSSGLFDRS